MGGVFMGGPGNAVGGLYGPLRAFLRIRRGKGMRCIHRRPYTPYLSAYLRRLPIPLTKPNILKNI